MNDILPHYINGEFIQSNSPQHLEIHDPATQELLARVPVSYTHLTLPTKA